MRDLARRKQALRTPVLMAIVAAATLGALAPAHADSVYEVSINTSSLTGSASIMAFDFIAGGGTQSNSATISDFSTNGVLVSGGTNSGSVSGSLPGTVTLTNAGFFNELQQGITLGSTISFQVDLTAKAPSSGALPDTFSLFLLDPTASYSLTNTGDPTGANSLMTVQVDGSSKGNGAVYSGSTPGGPVTVMAVGGSVAAPEIDASSAASALSLLLGGLAVLRGRQQKGMLAHR